MNWWRHETRWRHAGWHAPYFAGFYWQPKKVQRRKSSIVALYMLRTIIWALYVKSWECSFKHWHGRIFPRLIKLINVDHRNHWRQHTGEFTKHQNELYRRNVSIYPQASCNQVDWKERNSRWAKRKDPDLWKSQCLHRHAQQHMHSSTCTQVHAYT